jgi:hypothetical protein
MLLHYDISFQSATRLGVGRSIIDMSIPEVGITLVGGRDVMTRTPYPNKHYVLPCAKGRKAEQGMLIDVGDAPDEMTLVTRWAIDAERVAVHEVAIRHAGPRRDVIATSASLWRAWGHDDWTWDDDAWPAWADRNNGAMFMDPRMNELDRGQETMRPRDDVVADGRVIRRRESLDVTSIGRDRYDWIARVRQDPPMPLRAVNR